MNDFEWELTDRCIMGGLKAAELEWLTEERMELTFGEGLPSIDPNKGYSQEWRFEHPDIRGGFIVYFRRGRSSIGGTGGPLALQLFSKWLQSQIDPGYDPEA